MNMARRMFSPAIVCTDTFLDMPTSTQALYFQLGMYADDDGFVGPKKIMRMLGATDDELKLLIAKKFVIPFESQVIVIRHWKVNNLVRRDWYRPTIHLEEKNTLKTAESGTYYLVNETVPNSVTQVGSKVVSKVVNYNYISTKENAGSLESIGENLRKAGKLPPKKI
jgi:hypothetical protein